MNRTFLAVCLILCLTTTEARAELFLSDYLGVASGSSTSSSNAPFTTVVTVSAFGFGADIPGNFASNPIEFSDSGPFAKGVGVHSPTRIDFDLNELRSVEDFNLFSAVAGIDTPSLVDVGITPSASSGVSFEVFLDGVSVFTTDIANGGEPSVPLSIDVSSASVLTLATEDFGQRFGNHGAWGIASLVVPEPASLSIFALASLLLIVRRHR